MKTRRLVFSILTLACIFLAEVAHAQIILTQPAKDAFAIVTAGKATAVQNDNNEYPGVKRAIANFIDDVMRVTDVKPTLVNEVSGQGPIIIVGTIGKNAVIDG